MRPHRALPILAGLLAPAAVAPGCNAQDCKWMDLKVTGPGERFLAPLVWDSTRHTVLLFGGAG